jgi:phosphoglycerate dehydrogenase-like enzyme
VCEVEPVPDDSPLWSTPNLVVTPHRAGFSQRRPAETHAFALEQLERYLTGQPLQNITDKRAGF